MSNSPSAIRHSPLSEPARRLRAALFIRHAFAPPLAVRDADLAPLVGVPARQLVDLAAALAAHGELVLATCGPTPGRFLLRPGDDLAPARAYLDSLRGRALAVLRRLRLYKRAVALRESQRSPDSTGQLALPLESVSSPPAGVDLYA